MAKDNDPLREHGKGLECGRDVGLGAVRRDYVGLTEHKQLRAKGSDARPRLLLIHAAFARRHRQSRPDAPGPAAMTALEDMETPGLEAEGTEQRDLEHSSV